MTWAVTCTVWNETVSGSNRGLRGGSWHSDPSYLASSTRLDFPPTAENYGPGVRVVIVPEPCSIILMLAGGFGLLGYAWRRRKQGRSLALAVDSTLSSDDETGPAILSMPSRWTGSARKAA